MFSLPFIMRASLSKICIKEALQGCDRAAVNGRAPLSSCHFSQGLPR